jgi:hypothetical protein
MNYVGIDWAYARAAFCAMGEGGEKPTRLAAADASEVDAELVRLGTGEDLKDGEGLLEIRFGDPPLLVDALVLDHRDLRRRATPGQGPELQKAQEDRKERVVRLRGRRNGASREVQGRGIVPQSLRGPLGLGAIGPGCPFQSRP